MRLTFRFIILLPLLLKVEAKPFLKNDAFFDADHFGDQHEYGFGPNHGSSSSAARFAHFGAPQEFQHFNYFHGPPAHNFDYPSFPNYPSPSVPHAHINSRFHPHQYPFHPVGWRLPQANHDDCKQPNTGTSQLQSKLKPKSQENKTTIPPTPTITTTETSNHIFTAPLAPTTPPPSPDTTMTPNLAATDSTISNYSSSTTEQDFGIDIRFGTE